MAGEQIVIIDDDPDMREALTCILEPAGYKVAGYATGAEGMAAVRAHPPALILLDIMLASPSEGFHVAYELKKDEELKKIPIVMISAIGRKMGMDYAKETGSDYLPVERFLDKPLDAKTVLQTIAEVLPQGGARKGKS